MLAWRKLAQVSEANTDPAVVAEAAEQAYTALRWRLTGLIGRDGFAALLNRALRLAQVEFPALEGITLDARAETGLRGIHDFAQLYAGSRDAVGGLTAILAHIIDLLVVFIGEDIAVGLVYDAWPEVADRTTERRSEYA
jgi:hypothetical protein